MKEKLKTKNSSSSHFKKYKKEDKIINVADLYSFTSEYPKTIIDRTEKEARNNYLS